MIRSPRIAPGIMKYFWTFTYQCMPLTQIQPARRISSTTSGSRTHHLSRSFEIVIQKCSPVLTPTRSNPGRSTTLISALAAK